MAFKFVVVLAFVSVASAGYIQPQQQQYYQAAPAEHTVALTQGQHVLTKKVEEYDPHPQYKYAYDVQDTITGDSKSQSETRNGDAVEGEYSLIDADGYKRIVHYTADDEHGFNAVVTRVPLNGAHHHEDSHHEVKVATPVAYAAAPTVVKTVQPVAYAAPSYYKSAPVHYAPSAVLKSVGPASYASPSYYKSDSVAYAAPAVVKTIAPASYSAPAYYKSAPVVHSAQPSYVHAQETYSAPEYVKSLSSGYHH